MSRPGLLFLLLLALLAGPAGFAAPAQAHHRAGHEGGPWEDGADDGWVGDEDPAAGEPVPGDPADAEPPAPAPAPAPPVLAPVVVPKGHTVAGRVAYVRADGRAALPRSAPRTVKAIITAANQIVGRPYKWGGGHARLFDRGYDCSGAVGYALIRTGLLGGPVVSGQLARWGAGGAGRWVSVYATGTHVYMEVAGLRFDTSPVADPTGRQGVRWRPVIGKRPGFHTRHPAGL